MKLRIPLAAMDGFVLKYSTHKLRVHRLFLPILLIVFGILYECLAITNFGSRSHYHHNPGPWGPSEVPVGPYFYTTNGERGTRNTDGYPPPQLPWEEALRHSVYLTLVRDKIDALLLNSQRFNPQHPNKVKQPTIDDDDDVNLWRNIRRAPFIPNNKERGPVFGDIAILSRGKLIEAQAHGLQFVEDEDIKECIECHSYSSRLNELQAEKTFVAACIGPECKNNEIKALWTVRRIRHRNQDPGEGPFKYELMFSIASAKPDGRDLDYNAPSQTFTIMEADKVVRTPPDQKIQQKQPTVFKQGVESSDKDERTYWVHKNVDVVRQPSPSERNVYRERYPSPETVHAKPQLNTGEVYLLDDQYNRRQHYYNSEDFTKFTDLKEPTLNTKGHKKYVDEEEFTATEDGKYIKGIKNGKRPVITHLHHHYYLNDKGIPVLKSATKFGSSDKFETFLPNMYKQEIVTAPGESPPVFTKNVPRTVNFEGTPVTEVLYTKENPRTIYVTTQKDPAPQPTTPIYVPEIYAVVEEVKLQNNHYENTPENILSTPSYANTQEQSRKGRPTKPFRPSPVDNQMKYSEEDPILPPTLSTPISYTTDGQVHFTNSKKPIREESDTIQQTYSSPHGESAATIKYQEDKTTERAVYTSDATSTIQNIYSQNKVNKSEHYEDSMEQYKAATPTEETTTINVETTQIVYPESESQNPTIRPTRKKTSNLPKPDRGAYKTNRRVKQKKFSELVNAQVPSPNDNQPTTLQYTVAPLTTQPSSEAVSSTPENERKPKNINLAGRITVPRTRTNTSQITRNGRVKYPRKISGVWSSRRIRPKATTTEKTTSTTSEINGEESEIKLYVPVDNITEVLVFNNVSETTTERENYPERFTTTPEPVTTVLENQDDIAVTAQRKETTADDATKETLITTDPPARTPKTTRRYIKIHRNHNESDLIPLDSEKRETTVEVSVTSTEQTTRKLEYELYNSQTRRSSSTIPGNLDYNGTTAESPTYNVRRTSNKQEEETQDHHKRRARITVARTPTTEATTVHARRTTHKREDELYSPRTRKSYVTSISLKLGNKTRPYRHPSTASPKEEINKSTTLREPFKWIENTTFMEDLLKQFDFDNAMKAKISEVTKTDVGGQFKVYKAEESTSGDRDVQLQSDEMDTITHQIIEHAKSVNLASSHTNDDT